MFCQNLCNTYIYLIRHYVGALPLPNNKCPNYILARNGASSQSIYCWNKGLKLGWSSYPTSRTYPEKGLDCGLLVGLFGADCMSKCLQFRNDAGIVLCFDWCRFEEIFPPFLRLGSSLWRHTGVRRGLRLVRAIFYNRSYWETTSSQQSGSININSSIYPTGVERNEYRYKTGRCH